MIKMENVETKFEGGIFTVPQSEPPPEILHTDSFVKRLMSPFLSV